MPFARGRARPSPWPVAAALLACLSCSDPVVADASAELEAEPAVLDFDLAFVGDRVAREIEVRSNGRMPVRLSALSGPEGFLIEPATVELAAGGTARLRVVFAPAAAGVSAGKLVLGDDDARLGLGVRGTGVVRQLEAQAQVDFGPVSLGESAEAPVRLVNRSVLPMTLEATVEGQAAHEFRPAPGPVTVPAGGSTDLGVTFAPENRGGARAVLLLTACGTCEPVEVDLRGEGLLDRVVADPPLLDFGALSIGGTRTLPVALRNLGDVARTVAAVGVSPDAGEYGLAGGEVPLDVDLGDRASFEVSFAPLFEGTRDATLRFLDEAGRTVVEVPLAGTGQRLAVVAQPAALDFGGQAVGWSQTRKVTIRVGGGTLPIRTAAIEGAATVFRATAARPLPTEIGDPLEVEVTFAPPVAGPHEAVLVLATDDPGWPEVRVPLAGVGQVEGPCRIDVRPAELRFGLVTAGSIHRGTVTVANVGTGGCRLANAGLDEPPGPFTLEAVENPVVLAPGEAHGLEVVYAPPAGDYRTDRGVLRFSSNDSTRSLVLVTLSGTAYAGDLRALPDPLDFGTITFGKTAYRTLELRNAGPTALTLSTIFWAAGTPADFQLVHPPVLPAQLAPGAGVTLGVAITPGSAAALEATLEVGVAGTGATKRVQVRALAVVGECGAECHAPIALCPGRVMTEVTEEVALVGKGLDPDGDPVTCQWTLTTRPAGSGAALRSITVPCGTAFTADLVGDYEAELVLTDPTGYQGRCVAPVHADPYSGLWIETVWNVDADVDLHLLNPAHYPGIDPFDAWSWNGLDGADCFYWSCRAGQAALAWDAPGTADDPSLDVDSQHSGPENIRIDVPSRTHPYWVGVHWLYNQLGHASAQVTTKVYCGRVLATTQTTTLLHRQHAVLGRVDVNPDGTCAFTASGVLLSY